MKRLFLGWMLFCGVFLINFPATWFSVKLLGWSEGHLKLSNETGTLWQGSAEVNWLGNSQTVHWPGRVEWRLQPVWGGLRWSLHQADVQSHLDFSGQWRWGQGEWQPGQAEFPAALLDGLGSPFTTLHPSGLVDLHWGAARWNGQGWQAPWTVDGIWMHAGTPMAPLSPLGDYEVRLMGGQTGGHMTLVTHQGPLRLQGHGEESAGHFHFIGHAAVDPEDRVLLSGFLSILGKPEGEGVRLEWSH
ncbi:MAG: type II secretion system protein N [Ferrovum sp.]|nr:type II secretion system protein N [Ferrovum sp.]